MPELTKCGNRNCDRLTTADYCCEACRIADEGRYEIHETGPLAHSEPCDKRNEQRQTMRAGDWIE